MKCKNCQKHKDDLDYVRCALEVVLMIGDLKAVRDMVEWVLDRIGRVKNERMGHTAPLGDRTPQAYEAAIGEIPQTGPMVEDSTGPRPNERLADESGE